MLQRAASSACSWWWASHIRTKQSKWLEQSLQDMEEKVQSMLKLIEEDGDSFAKRAEMYYKRRPELISSVEETYRAFKALADRYDLLSKELQNANRTIATVFPEQVQFAMDEYDDCPTPKPKNSQIPAGNKPNVPKVPNVPMENLKGFINTASKQFQTKKKSSKAKVQNKPVVKSGLSTDEALGEIDKMHKEILTLQTVKEYVKSSYESGLAKYWEIENQIMEMQEKVCRLQDEFDVEVVIEDNEARTLMAEAALKSCQETLAVLQEKQEKSTREAKEEFKKIEAARQLLKSIRCEFMKEQTNEQKPDEDDNEAAKGRDESKSLAKDVSDLIQEQEKTDNSLDLSSMATLTVTELAEKIDELVNKVISLETAVSSQTVLINTLRTEADDLHAQIKNLEDEKETLIGDTHNLNTRVKEMEEKLNRIQDLNKNVESQNNNLQTNFAKARSSLDHLSEKLSSVKPDEELEETGSSQDVAKSSSESRLQEEIKDQKDVQSPRQGEKRFSTSKTEERKEVKGDTNIQGSEPSVPEQEEVKKPSESPYVQGSAPSDPKQKVGKPNESSDVQGSATSVPEQEEIKKPSESSDIQGSVPSVSKQEEIQNPNESSDVQVSVPPVSKQESKNPNESSDVKGSEPSVSKQEEVRNPNESSDVQGSAPSVPKQGEVKKPTESSDVQDSAPSVPKQGEVKKPTESSDVQGSAPSVLKQEETKKPAKKTVTFLDPVDHRDETVKAQTQGETTKEDDLSWQQMLLSGTEDREKILLKEYTTILRNYKDVKRKLSDTEKKEKESQFDITLQMTELKEAILKRDQEIQRLRQRLSLLQGDKDVKEETSVPSNSSGDRSVKPESGSEDSNVLVTDKEEEIKSVFIDRTETISAVEEKLRLAIDAILDENLDFWLRFSTAFHQVQKFKSEVQDLQDEISKLKEKKKHDGSATTQLKSEVRPIYKHFREIQTELTMWLEQSVSLKDELKRRSASLCSIQEEITKALKEGVEEDEIRFSTHQAAKLQGEILNMRQENNKVKEELHACLDHVSLLQLEIEKTLRQLNGEFGISSDQPQLQHSMSRSRVPLRSFIFGTRPKKQKNSIFSFMHHNRKFHVVRPALSPV